MKQDHGDAEREHELGAGPVQGIEDPPEHVRADERAHDHQHHLGQPQRGGDGLRQEPGAHDQPEVEDYLLGVHEPGVRPPFLLRVEADDGGVEVEAVHDPDHPAALGYDDA